MVASAHDNGSVQSANVVFLRFDNPHIDESIRGIAGHIGTLQEHAAVALQEIADAGVRLSEINSTIHRLYEEYSTLKRDIEDITRIISKYSAPQPYIE